MSENTPYDSSITLIDAHHHLWDLEKNHHPWLARWDPHTFMGDYRPIMKNYLPEDYRRDSQGHRVLATVHCEADHDYQDEVAETRWLKQISTEQGMPNVAIAHAWFHLPQCEEILHAQCEFSFVRGIRSKPITASTPETRQEVYGKVGSMQDDNWLQGFSLLEKFGLSWDLRVPYWHLAEAAEVAKTFPQTMIVINHMGFPWDRSERGLEAWREGMSALAACPNVYVKISELGAPGLTWTIDNHQGLILETVKMFGIDRCMFASNFPVAGLQISYHQLVSNMSAIMSSFTEAEQEAFFWRNAQSFYRIELPNGE